MNLFPAKQKKSRESFQIVFEPYYLVTRIDEKVAKKHTMFYYDMEHVYGEAKIRRSCRFYLGGGCR